MMEPEMIARIAATLAIGTLAAVAVANPASAGGFNFSYESLAQTPAPTLTAPTSGVEERAHTTATPRATVTLVLHLNTRGTFIIKTSPCSTCAISTHATKATGKDVKVVLPAGTARFNVGYKTNGMSAMMGWQTVS